MGRDLPIYYSYPHPVYGVVGFVGELFLWGATGGAAFHFARGLVRGVPSGGRLAGAVHAASANAPRVAGTFGAYCAAFSAFEEAFSHARGGRDMWCSVSASAAIWGLHSLRRGGGTAAAAGGALLGAAGILAIYGFEHECMVRESRRADADGLLCLKQMIDRGEPTPVALAASRAAVPDAERPPVEMLFAMY
ncbi:unnamed protein product [Urochloa decumbens]|uniref:Uncharacterized protein n=1 Tax=Urochloa decumbens TaxID=240449 RepID=A0ABC9BMX0_9POAL